MIGPSRRSIAGLTKLGTSGLLSGVTGCQCRYFSTRVLSNDNKTQYQLDCETLSVTENCDEEAARSAFIKLAKRYHPDGTTNESDAAKFHEVNTAYKNLLKRFAEERHNQHIIEGEYGLYYEFKKKTKVEDTTVDIEADHNEFEHPIPQHRRHLEFEGVGTLYQRQKQSQNKRAAKSISRVQEHRINQMTMNDQGTDEKSLVHKDKQAAKNSKISQGIERMVEDLIQESMAKGEFDNLKGQGKPLKHDTSHNPYIDFTTQKLNQILLDNGFTPEWILLEKEIRQEIRSIRQKLTSKRHKYDENMTASDCLEWENFLKGVKLTVNELNSKIQRYNLLVPILHKQIICLDMDREVRKALDSSNLSVDTSSNRKNEQMSATSSHVYNGSFLDSLFSYFTKT